MSWLILMVLILQAAFYWVIKPTIIFATPILELRGLGMIVLLLSIWVFSQDNGSKFSD